MTSEKSENVGHVIVELEPNLQRGVNYQTHQALMR